MSENDNQERVLDWGNSVDRRKFISLAGVGVGAGLAGCAGGSDGEPTDTEPTETETEGSGNGEDTDMGSEKMGGHLRVTFSRNITRISPIHTDSVFTQRLPIRLLYSNMTYIDYDMGLQNDLATNFEPQDDDLTEWVIEMRDDAVFPHNGEPVTAEDAAASWMTLNDPDMGNPGGGAIGGIDTAEAVDDYTVQVQLNRSNADFPMYLAKAWASIAPKDILENDVESLNTEDYGSGPFNMTEYEGKTKLVCERNPDYYREDSDGNQLPYVDKITYTTIPDGSTEVTQLQNNESDILWNTSISQFPRLESMSGADALQAPSGNMIGMVMDNAVEPWDDGRVRKAVQLGINRDEFMSSVISGYGSKGQDSILSPMYRFYEDLPERTQDKEQARQLLADAGYPDGFNLSEDFDMTFFSAGSPEFRINSAILFQEQLQDIGIEMDLEQISYDNYIANVWREAPTYAVYYGARFNEDDFLSLMIHSEGPWWRENHWENEEKDEAIDQARATRDEEERQELYGKVQRLMYEEGPYAIPFYVDNLGGKGNYVNNYQRHSLLTQDHYDQASLTSDAPTK